MLAELRTPLQRQHMMSPFFALVLEVLLTFVAVVPVWAVDAWVEDMVQEVLVNLQSCLTDLCMESRYEFRLLFGLGIVERYLGSRMMRTSLDLVKCLARDSDIEKARLKEDRGIEKPCSRDRR